MIKVEDYFKPNFGLKVQENKKLFSTQAHVTQTLETHVI